MQVIKQMFPVFFYLFLNCCQEIYSKKLILIKSTTCPLFPFWSARVGMEEWLAASVEPPPQGTVFLAHSLGWTDAFHKGQEWTYRKQILLCLHLFLLISHLRSTDSDSIYACKTQITLLLSAQQEAFIVRKRPCTSGKESPC